ncbi:amidohydrolase [Kwoniella heveanensis CBS 569]|nr:amidohydrolase [Kwoniella heveanensis CBS 569]
MSEQALQRRRAAADGAAPATTFTPYQRHPPPPRRGHPTRSLHISLSLLILGFFVIYAQKSGWIGLKSTRKVYSVKGRPLPQKYAICSQEGTRVYTVPEEEGVGQTECVVVIGKDVVDTGSLGKIRRKWITGVHDQKPKDAMKVIYLPPGHSLTPGLVDSHGHPLAYGHAQQLPLHGCKSKEEVVARVEEYVRNNPLRPGTWVEGLGWDQNLWEGQQFPTADDFDESPILRGVPISLYRVDYHVTWVSKQVLSFLGDVPNVEGGQVVRDESGLPTGVFIDNAIDLVKAIQPPWSDEDKERYLNVMIQDALSKGLTGVHDAQMFLKDAPFWTKMMAENKLPIRFYAMVPCQEEGFCGDKVEKVVDQDSHFILRSVKLFADGALGSRGAALIDDYSDQPGWRGLMLKEEKTWEPLIRQWHEAGWQVNTHTIGDRAANVVLNAIQTIVKGNPEVARQARFRIEHAQIMKVTDIRRAAKLGVIASVQPTHATSDMWYAEDRIGHERMKGAYAWRSYLNNDGRIALGSDFPVESIDPLKGFYAAVTRLSEDGRSPHGRQGWYPHEKLTREEALRGMTVDATYASFSEITGSLTPGKRFDAVIWDDDLLTVPENEMLEVKAKAVIVDGRLVWGQLD